MVVASMRRATSWLTADPLIQLPTGSTNRGYALAFARRETVLRARDGTRRRWRLAHTFEAVQLAGDSSAWQVKTTGYAHEFRHSEGIEVLAYHWHPLGVSAITWPHVHLHQYTAPLNLSRAHVPTNRVSLQAIVRFAIMDLRIPPIAAPRQSRPNESRVLSELAEAIEALAD
jgi:hypothetical protein